MGLRPQQKCHIRFPLGGPILGVFRIFTVKHWDPRRYGINLADNTIVVRVDVHRPKGSQGTLPNPGKRYRDVLICQPPIKAMKTYMNCCSQHRLRTDTRKPCETIKNKNGLRVGDLLDAYLRIPETHRLCPDAHLQLHDEEGFVKPGIYFEAHGATLEDDPELLARLSAKKKASEEWERVRALEPRLRPYMQAKRAGKLSCAPRFPCSTLAYGWRETHPV